MPRTNNVPLFTTIYAVTNIFLNPMGDDDFPPVNPEVCRTPVITYDTGGKRRETAERLDLCIAARYVEAFDPITA